MQAEHIEWKEKYIIVKANAKKSTDSSLQGEMAAFTELPSGPPQKPESDSVH